MGRGPFCSAARRMRVLCVFVSVRVRVTRAPVCVCVRLHRPPRGLLRVSTCKCACVRARACACVSVSARAFARVLVRVCARVRACAAVGVGVRALVRVRAPLASRPSSSRMVFMASSLSKAGTCAAATTICISCPYQTWPWLPAMQPSNMAACHVQGNCAAAVKVAAKYRWQQQ